MTLPFHTVIYEKPEMMLSKYVLSLDYIDKTQLQMSIRCLRDLSFNMFPLVLVLSFQKKKKKKGKILHWIIKLSYLPLNKVASGPWIPWKLPEFF